MNKSSILFLVLPIVCCLSCLSEGDNRIFPDAYKNDDELPVFLPNSDLKPQKVQGINFYGFKLLSETDTILGYWGNKQGKVYFMNVYDIDCERLITMTSFNDNIDNRYNLSDDDCSIPYIYELVVTSKIIKSNDDEIITEVKHEVNDPTLKIIDTIPYNGDTTRIKKNVTAYFKFSSKRGIIEFKRTSKDTRFYLPY